MEMAGFIKNLEDSSFQAELLQSPHKTLQKIGVEISPTTQVRVVRNSEDSINMIVPAKSSDITTLSDEQLTHIAAGEAIISYIAVGTAITFAIVGGIAGVAAIGATLGALGTTAAGG